MQHTHTPRTEYLTAAEAGRLAGGLTASAVRAATARGQLQPALITAGGIRLYLPDAVLGWRRTMAERRRAREAQR